VRIYEKATILTPGIWADSVTQKDCLYTAKALKKHSKNWESNHLDLGHDVANPLSIVGSVQNQCWEDGAIKGDLFINPITQNARDAIALIDAGLVNNLSIEMVTDDYWDNKQLIRSADDIVFLGVAIVGPFPACTNTRIR
jgi:hypothetical protein